ncbi:MAG: ATP-dependent RecD-like DNA helicase [Firmicutes bacterium]|nr:ATP-dependent RecD-like DNA helicase [Bacillota bacterium]
MVVIEGTVEEIIFSNEANGYVVCEVACENGVVTVVGYMPFLSEGEILRIRGAWVTHPDYGDQVQVEYYEKIMPETAEAIEKYLAAGVIKGIRKATAKKVVRKFGDDTLKIILEQPERLTEIKGIGLPKALEIGKAFAKHRQFTGIVSFLHEYGISPAYTAKIYKIFGDSTIEEIKKNPYRLTDEITAITFKIADRIAKSLGIDPSSELRICSGIKYVLSQAALNGHTYLPLEKLEEYSLELLEVDIENISNALASMVFKGSIYMEREEGKKDKVYLSQLYQAEISVASRLLALSKYGSLSDKKDVYKAINERIDKTIKYVHEKDGITLAEAQKYAIKEALTNGVLVITGGPGTGKTTIIKSIIKLLKKEGYEIALAAPTGRAAKRMTEATGFHAKTIHRLLETGYLGEDEEPSFGRTELNPIDADVIIVDEMSMVDIFLMDSLVKAVKPGAKLILVGDVDQLPSVGPGNVLKDIIMSGSVKTVRLTEVFRQAEESMIVVNAHRVNRGEKPIFNIKNKDFFFVSRENADSIVKTVVELCSRRIPAQFGYDPIKDIQVLTPTKKGHVGVANLNIELQKELNPKGRNKKEKAFPNFLYREGDKVMQIKNNYNIKWVKVKDSHNVKDLSITGTNDTNDTNIEGMGVFNGDTGIIHSIDEEDEIITVVFDDDKIVEYSFDAFDEIEPAYAITIHKSQGSEFPVVILPVFSGPPVLMTRNLLYTAITRARDLVIIVGMEKVLYNMVQNDRETLRYSGLGDKLAKCGKIDRY